MADIKRNDTVAPKGDDLVTKKKEVELDQVKVKGNEKQPVTLDNYIRVQLNLINAININIVTMIKLLKDIKDKK